MVTGEPQCCDHLGPTLCGLTVQWYAQICSWYHCPPQACGLMHMLSARYPISLWYYIIAPPLKPALQSGNVCTPELTYFSIDIENSEERTHRCDFML